MGISKITRNYQLTLPRDIREQRDLKVGDNMLFLIEGKKIELIKMDKKIVEKTAGLWSPCKETGIEYERRLRKEWKKRQS